MRANTWQQKCMDYSARQAALASPAAHAARLLTFCAHTPHPPSSGHLKFIAWQWKFNGAPRLPGGHCLICCTCCTCRPPAHLLCTLPVRPPCSGNLWSRPPARRPSPRPPWPASLAAPPTAAIPCPMRPTRHSTSLGWAILNTCPRLVARKCVYIDQLASWGWVGLFGVHNWGPKPK